MSTTICGLEKDLFTETTKCYAPSKIYDSALIKMEKKTMNASKAPYF